MSGDGSGRARPGVVARGLGHLRSSDGRSGQLGVLAQALTFAALVVPIVGGRGEALVVIVGSTALVTCSLPAMTRAASHLLPTIETASAARAFVLRVAALMPVWGALVTLAAYAFFGGWLGAHRWAAGVSVGAAAVAQATFQVGLAWLTRWHDYGRAMRLRLMYGAVLIALTTVLTVVDAIALLYVVAIAVAYAAGIALIFGRHARSALRCAMLAPRELPHAVVDLWRERRLVAATTLGAVSSQIGALITPGLGALAAPWAAGVRVVSGFQTFGWLTVGTRRDMATSAAVRRGDVAALDAAVRASVRIGLAIGLVGGLAAAGVVRATESVGIDAGGAVVVAIALYGFGSGAFTTIGRILAFVGRPGMQLVWEAARLAAGAVPLLLPTPTSVAIGVGVAAVVSSASYIVLAKGAVALYIARRTADPARAAQQGVMEGSRA